MKILLAEDDLRLGKMLKTILSKNGINVKWVTNGESSYDECYADGYDVLVLDWMMPGMSGLRVCEELRKSSTVPILFLTAKDEEFDVVRGLDAGGNDYVTKPFRMMELLSRIRALLRRNTPAPITTSGELEIDPSHMQVRRDGEIIPLTLTEYKVLNMLVSNRSIVTREQLLDVLWDDGAKFVDDNTLSVHISRLREKIGAQHIKTIRGVGYQWLA